MGMSRGMFVIPPPPPPPRLFRGEGMAKEMKGGVKSRRELKVARHESRYQNLKKTLRPRVMQDGLVPEEEEEEEANYEDFVASSSPILKTFSLR